MNKLENVLTVRDDGNLGALFLRKGVKSYDERVVNGVAYYDVKFDSREALLDFQLKYIQ